MKNQNIITTLKKDISELKTLKQDYKFNRVFCFGVYSIILNFFISGCDYCFNKTFREIQFKNKINANNFIDLLNKEMKPELKPFI